MGKFKSGSQEGKIPKVRKKILTRAQAEYQLSHGADFNDEAFTKHANYHVRRRAWYLAGKPLPENAEERTKFLQSIKIAEAVAE